MPFVGYDPRELHCYNDLQEPEVDIPTTDNAAWKYFKNERWVYNKLNVATSQEIPCGPIGVKPTRYPIVIKPIYNMFGGGIDARKISNANQLERYLHPGCMWMDWIDGIHHSHDIMILKGKPVWSITFKGYPIDKGMFDYWEVEIPQKFITEYVYNWIINNLKSYTGCVCIETITNENPVIIETHLRMGDVDRLGNYELMNSVIQLYQNKEWKFKEQIDKFYLFAIWGENSIKYRISQNIVTKLCQKLSSYQIDKPELYYQNPVGGVRLAILNGYVKGECLSARNALIPHFYPAIPQYLRQKLIS